MGYTWLRVGGAVPVVLLARPLRLVSLLEQVNPRLTSTGLNPWES